MLQLFVTQLTLLTFKPWHCCARSSLFLAFTNPLVLVPLGLPLESSSHVGQCVPRDGQLNLLLLLLFPVDDYHVWLLSCNGQIMMIILIVDMMKITKITTLFLIYPQSQNISTGETSQNITSFYILTSLAIITIYMR